MPFPLIPFMLGAAAGSTTAYVATSKIARQKIESGADKIVNTVKNSVKATKTKLFGKKTPAATGSGEESTISEQS